MMKKYEIGLYEKAMRNTLSWSEKLKCAKECGYDYMEMCIDATDEKINRIFMNTAEKKEIMEAVFQAVLPIGSMSVSALTKYALGDPGEEIRKKAMQIAEKSIELAVDLGVRTVMIPGYDIYFGESTIETKKYFLENVKKIAEIAEREGILVGFETMENNFMNTTGKAVQYVNMVDSAYLKIYPDAGNITNAAVENQHDCSSFRRESRTSISHPFASSDSPFLVTTLTAACVPKSVSSKQHFAQFSISCIIMTEAES